LAGAGAALRPLLQRAGLSPEQFARRLNQRASELGIPNRIDQKTPYKWFRGTLPRQPWPTLTAHLLSARLGWDISVEDLGWIVGDADLLCVPADSGLALPWTAQGALAAAAEVMDGTPMDRRLFLGLTGSALTSPALDWLLAQPVSDVTGFAGRRIQGAHVDSVEEMTAQLRRMDDQFGGGAVLDLVRAQVRYVVQLLRDYSYTSDVGERLHGAAAELLRLGGWLSFDTGKQAQAQRYWLAALHSSHAANDRAVGANVLGFMSCQAKDVGLYDDAIKLAEAALRGYPGTSPRVVAILSLRAAQAYAQVNDVNACRSAIDSAYEALHDVSPETTEPSWAYWLNEAQANEQIGYCYLKLEDWSRARSHFRTALRLQDNPDTREGALRQALLAVTYARQGEPEHACQAATTATSILAKDVDSDRCVGHVRQVQAALDPYRKVPLVAEFNENVDRLFGVPA
jgi:hypothetical protein